MKKFLIAAAASVLLFGGQAAEASTVDNLDVKLEQTQETGKWSHFRDKYIRGRETENERRDREERERWERDSYYPPPPPPRQGHYGALPPPPPRPGYGPPPRPGYGPPPPRR